MFKRLIELLKSAPALMRGNGEDKQIVEDLGFNISDKMAQSISIWKDWYKNNPKYKDENNGIYTLGLPKTICQEMTRTVLSEMETHITAPNGVRSGIDDTTLEEPTTRSEFLDDIYKKRLMAKLRKPLEYAMAVGGMIVKPYVSNNSIYFDFSYQGDFYPIEFDADGNITDIAFLDQFISGNKIYSRVERHQFDNNTVTITNKAFENSVQAKTDDLLSDLGSPIPLASVKKWATYSEEPAIINDVDRPLYGYYQVPLANNIDIDCPLGVSIFQPAMDMIERADKQFSRLDWEYEGGQIAIDVDPTAIVQNEGYYGTQLEQDQYRNRVYRRIDLGSDETYNAFAPALRDSNYQSGLVEYLTKIEDTCGLARGTLSQVDQEARTATEIKILKQRQYLTVQEHQVALEKCLDDAIYAMNVLVELYSEELQAPQGEYTTVTEWQDSILTDTDTELAKKLELLDKGILADYEVRSWYTGEDEETAKNVLTEMKAEKQALMMNDIFSQVPQTTLEGNGEDDETSKQKPVEEEGE